MRWFKKQEIEVKLVFIVAICGLVISASSWLVLSSLARGNSDVAAWQAGDTGSMPEVVAAMSNMNMIIPPGAVEISAIVLGGMVLLALMIYQLIRKSVVAPAQRLETAARALAQGDLTTHIQCHGDDALARVGFALNGMATEFKQMLDEISASATLVTRASEKLIAIAEQANNETSKLKVETEKVANAMNEMSLTSLQVADDARQTVEPATVAHKEALKEKGMMNKAANAIHLLAEEIESVADVVEKLQKDSSDIGTVLDVIRDIAEQTNLLALNAAIEAARAGEQGRGFAVVADEVRTLANRTEDSTKEIQSMIERLQQGSREAVQVMSDSRGRAEDTVEQAAVIQNMLLTITEHVESTNNMCSKIATAAIEQNVVTEEMNKNITMINDITHSSERSSLQIADASNELAGLSTGFQRLLSRFKTG